MSKKNFKTIIVSTPAVFLILILLVLFVPKKRDSVGFCETFIGVNDGLSGANGETYSLSFLDHRSSDPGDLAEALRTLEESSPDEIQSDVKTLRLIFEKIDDDPTQALSASLAGIGPENNVKQYINQNCEI